MKLSNFLNKLNADKNTIVVLELKDNTEMYPYEHIRKIEKEYRELSIKSIDFDFTEDTDIVNKLIFIKLNKKEI